MWDADGREYVDARAGLWYAAVGHGRTEIADAVAAQMRELAAFDTFDRLANRPALELADRVSALAPFPDAAVFFGSGGSDAVDTAAKLARRYWHALGQPDKRLIVHRQHSYHGMNAYGTSLAGIATNREGFGTLIADVASVPYDDPAGPGGAVRGARRRDRGVHRRAGHRRRRDPAPARGLLGGRPGAVPQA